MSQQQAKEIAAEHLMIAAMQQRNSSGLLTGLKIGPREAMTIIENAIKTAEERAADDSAAVKRFQDILEKAE